ncbi:MAG: fumarylacetoacetate hydrolase family protein [Pseudomonadota bacterium]
MIQKIILCILWGVFFLWTHTAAAKEVTTLCRFMDPVSGQPSLGAVMGDDRILPLQALYSHLNNGGTSALLESLEGFFAGGGAAGKALVNLLAVQAEKEGFPLLKAGNVRLLTPLEPKKLIAGSIFEGHATRSREAWARELVPVQWALAKMIGGGPFSPPAEHYQDVTYYQGNHLGWFSHKADIRLPEDWDSVDFEIEIGLLVVMAGDVPRVGGYFLFNDLTHRKTQGIEIDKVRHGFSVSKHLNAAGWKFVLADDVDFSKISASASVIRANGEVEDLCTGQTTDALFSPEEVLDSIARRDGGLVHGQVIATGTLSGCCGLEIRGAAKADLLYPGDTIRFESGLLGNLENTIARHP